MLPLRLVAAGAGPSPAADVFSRGRSSALRLAELVDGGGFHPRRGGSLVASACAHLPPGRDARACRLDGLCECYPVCGDGVAIMFSSPACERTPCSARVCPWRSGDRGSPRRRLAGLGLGGGHGDRGAKPHHRSGGSGGGHRRLWPAAPNRVRVHGVLFGAHGPALGRRNRQQSRVYPLGDGGPLQLHPTRRERPVFPPALSRLGSGS